MGLFDSGKVKKLKEEVDNAVFDFHVLTEDSFTPRDWAEIEARIASRVDACAAVGKLDQARSIIESVRHEVGTAQAQQWSAVVDRVLARLAT